MPAQIYQLLIVLFYNMLFLYINNDDDWVVTSTL